MANIHYHSVSQYLRSAKDIDDEIKRINETISALEDRLLDNAQGDGMKSYSLDDGQTSISVTLDEGKDIESLIKRLENRREKRINEKTGRSVRLVPGRNIFGCG